VKTKPRKLWYGGNNNLEPILSLEIMRHNQEDENRVNKTLIEFAQKHEVN
jgi:hypothetical protein